MKRVFTLICMAALLAVSCNSEFDAASEKLCEQMHAESCDIERVEETIDDKTVNVLEIELVNIDKSFFGHPDWVLRSYAAQEYYYASPGDVAQSDIVRVVLTDAMGNQSPWDFTRLELLAADSLYSRAEKIINEQNGLKGIRANIIQFDTTILDDVFPLIDSTINASKELNGPQESLSFGGFRRVTMEYMNTPVFQVIVQQRRKGKTDRYLFSFNETNGLVLSMQFNGPLD